VQVAQFYDTFWSIHDLGSSNGTRLNGLQVDKANLKTGDDIGIGSSQLCYEISLPVDRRHWRLSTGKME
jgi:pSer/pThr/pTyr-binding forkhead associated (FHA) protein